MDKLLKDNSVATREDQLKLFSSYMQHRLQTGTFVRQALPDSIVTVFLSHGELLGTIQQLPPVRSVDMLRIVMQQSVISVSESGRLKKSPT